MPISALSNGRSALTPNRSSAWRAMAGSPHAAGEPPRAPQSSSLSNASASGGSATDCPDRRLNNCSWRGLRCSAVSPSRDWRRAARGFASPCNNGAKEDGTAGSANTEISCCCRFRLGATEGRDRLLTRPEHQIRAAKRRDNSPSNVFQAGAAWRWELDDTRSAQLQPIVPWKRLTHTMAAP